MLSLVARHASVFVVERSRAQRLACRAACFVVCTGNCTTISCGAVYGDIQRLQWVTQVVFFSTSFATLVELCSTVAAVVADAGAASCREDHDGSGRLHRAHHHAPG